MSNTLGTIYIDKKKLSYDYIKYLLVVLTRNRLGLLTLNIPIYSLLLS